MYVKILKQSIYVSICVDDVDDLYDFINKYEKNKRKLTFFAHMSEERAISTVHEKKSIKKM